jgi:BirA family transcriptional regulator, biotin operon repressor / biotin---[acetyl-CoA-carboxylase] ligase
MKSVSLFHILDQTESTNNYAMARVRNGLAVDAEAWFTHHQTGGRGQRGKNWNSLPNQNLLMSIVLKVEPAFIQHPFLFNALIANTSRLFLSSFVDRPVYIKWPNDLYIDDRKAGGMLIENNYQGSQWQWSVLGIGINLNQTEFPDEAGRPVSLCQISKTRFDTVETAKQLHQYIIEAVRQDFAPDKILQDYNDHLFARNRVMRLRKDRSIFETKVVSVDAYGQLHCVDTIPRVFNFGEIEWLF